ncbi:MAG: hypothetical protein R3F01_05405 [Lysobacteraceae bacterium]
MEVQQRHGATKLRYRFDTDSVEYRVEDSSGSRTFNVAYTELSRDRQELLERNEWFRNAGMLWMLIGVVFTALSFGGERPAISLWFWIGLLCYLIFRLRTTRYTIIPSDKGNLLVIHNSDHDRIVNELETSRADQFRREYDFVPDGDEPDNYRKRLDWLKREGALSDEDVDVEKRWLAFMAANGRDERQGGVGRVLN